MKKQIKSADNAANQKNANRGSIGVNKQYAQIHGNRGKQLNPNQKSSINREQTISLLSKN